MNPPRKHLEDLCEWIDAVILGEAANQLADRHEKTGSGAILLRPSWAWAKPLISVGKKSSNSAMPIRLTWESGPITLHRPGETVTDTWHMKGLGHDQSGSFTTQVPKVSWPTSLPVSDHIDAVRLIPFASDRDLKSKLARTGRDGVTARWNLMRSLESYAYRQLQRFNQNVAAELNSAGTPIVTGHVLDNIAVDTALSRILLGDQNSSSSVVTRMIDRCLKSDSFHRVDPERYLTVSMRARAEEEVRRSIGDPKVGAKVRRIAQMHNPVSVEQLVRIYREKYPKDRLGTERAAAALTAGPSAGVLKRSIDDSNHRVGGDDE